MFLQDDDHEDSGLCPELIRAMEGVKYIAEVTRIVEDSNKVEFACISKYLHWLLTDFPFLTWSHLISFQRKSRNNFCLSSSKMWQLIKGVSLTAPTVWCFPSDICFLDNLFSLTSTTISNVTPDCAGIVVMKHATRLENN